MIKYTLLILFIISSFITTAQVTCAQLRDKTEAMTSQINLYEKKTTPSATDLQQFKTAYNTFRNFAVSSAAVEKDYDIHLLLQTMLIQSSTHYIVALQNENKYNDAWDEAQFIYNNVLLKSKYQQLARKDNWAGCSISVENKQMTIHEDDYKSICTDFIGFACNTALHINKRQAATHIFAATGFKGLLIENASLRRAAGDILIQRLKQGLKDDTTYLAAYEFLRSNIKSRSIADVMNEYSNLTTSKALEVVTDPVLVERTGIAPLNNIDNFKDIWNRYACLFTTLAYDTGFVYSAKFDILKIGVQHYLQMLNSDKVKDYAFFPYLTCIYENFDHGYKESGKSYSVERPMQDILNSGNKELLTGMAQVYETFAKHCIGSYPVIEKAHHYYSAYLCYYALGDSKKAKKAFNNIPKVMLANKTTAGLGYKKME